MSGAMEIMEVWAAVGGGEFAQFDIDPQAPPTVISSGASILLAILRWVGLAICVGVFMWGGVRWGIDNRRGSADQNAGKLMCLGGGFGALIIGVAPEIVKQFSDRGASIGAPVGGLWRAVAALVGA